MQANFQPKKDVNLYQLPKQIQNAHYIMFGAALYPPCIAKVQR